MDHAKHRSNPINCGKDRGQPRYIARYKLKGPYRGRKLHKNIFKVFRDDLRTNAPVCSGRLRDSISLKRISSRRIKYPAQVISSPDPDPDGNPRTAVIKKEDGYESVWEIRAVSYTKYVEKYNPFWRSVERDIAANVRRLKI